MAFIDTVYAEDVEVTEEETSAPTQEYSERELKGCLKCHGEDYKTPVVAILNSPHAVMADANTPFAEGNHACEGCHGKSRTHTEKYEDNEDRPPPGINFGPPSQGYSPVEVQNGVCEECHTKQGHINTWVGSEHEQNDVPCAGCHTSHSQSDPIMQRKTQSGKCTSCHTTQRMEARKLSHHPMNEGLVICTDCHSPHGSTGEASLIKPTINDTCYECHSEMRGPFLWEHEPVQESCSNCHLPHGSNNQMLLTKRPPWLCQQCHGTSGGGAGGHPSIQYDGDDLPPSGFAQRFVVKGCLNCHNQVHGSNHPSGVREHR
jgi:DmsE family decaheme c-type cytochrome